MNISGVDWLISFLSALFCKSFSVPFPSGYTPSHSPFVSLCPIPFYSVLFCSILFYSSSPGGARGALRWPGRP